MQPGKVGILYLRWEKKFFVVMPFGPKNAPAFYTAMMRILHDEWVVLFDSTKECVPSDPSLLKIFCDSKTIIDDTLIFPITSQHCSIISLVLLKSSQNIAFHLR